MNYKLSEICDIINGGAWKQAEYSETGIGVVKVSNLKSDGISGEISYLPESSLSKYEKHVLKPYDLVVTTVGSHAQLKESAAGRSFIISKDYDGFLLNQNVVCIRPKDSNILDKRFLGYFGKSSNFTNYVQSLGRGAANQMRIAISGIRNYEFSLPPLPTQRRIASILSAYDDLLENNLKRIRLLEEAAQNIYREWFVEMRFPDHEKAEWYTDETGRRLPEGWKYQRLGDFANINLRSITKKTAPESINYIDISSTNTGYFESPSFMPFNDAPSRARRIVQHGDTIFSTVRPNRKTYALVLNPKENLICSTGFAVISPKKEPQISFIYASISSKEFISKSVNVAGGAAYPAIKQSDFENLRILTPSDEYIQRYSDMCYKLMCQKGILLLHNEKLREAGDILLPRLMNQTIEV